MFSSKKFWKYTLDQEVATLATLLLVQLGVSAEGTGFDVTSIAWAQILSYTIGAAIVQFLYCVVRYTRRPIVSPEFEIEATNMRVTGNIKEEEE